MALQVNIDRIRATANQVEDMNKDTQEAFSGVEKTISTVNINWDENAVSAFK